MKVPRRRLEDARVQPMPGEELRIKPNAARARLHYPDHSVIGESWVPIRPPLTIAE
jgi:hypothetical protein